ncbi:MAG: sugar MFS transporter [Bacteroidales bacterium]|nr:sugar MFS transporter [Bacteroidales bacterium]
MNSSSKSDNYTLPFIVLTALFFMWGFFTVLNDILIPHLKAVFELTHFQAMLVQFAFFGAYFIGSLIYFIISVSFGDPINKIGYKGGILLGLALSAIGSALFYPATYIHLYWFYLMALFIVGLGFTLLQIAANPYVAILGKPETASSRLNLVQAFNSLGTTIGPAIGGYLIFHYFAGVQAVKIPYIVYAGIFLLLAFLIIVVKLPKITNPDEKVSGFGSLHYRNLVLGILAIFMYVGAEVSIGSILISFLGLKEIAGLNEADASTFLSFYWGGLMIGRFLGAISLSDMKNTTLKYWIMTGIPLLAFLVIFYLSDLQTASIYGIFLMINLLAFHFGKSLAGRTLTVFSLIIIMLLIISLGFNGTVAMWTVIGIGLFNSIMWSNIFTLAISGLGKYTSQGSSMLVMAILGGAIIPPLQGKFADIWGVHASFIVPVFSYIYLAYYGWSGFKVRKFKKYIENKI